MTQKLDLALLLAVFGVHKTNRIEGRTRIQKIVCLLQYSKKIPFNFDFRPFYYGPYSDELSESINSLVGMKLIKETVTPTKYGTFRYDYELTDEGRKLYKKIEVENRELTQLISIEVEQHENLPTNKLVKKAKIISELNSIRS